MSTASKRAALEAAIWRIPPAPPGTAPGKVDAALAAADAYADDARGEAITRMTTAAAARLARAAAEYAQVKR